MVSRVRLFTVTVLFAAAGIAGAPLDAQCRVDELTDSDASPFDQYGFSVALSGDVFVVGAVGSNTAYVYRFDGSQWLEEQQLTPSSPVTSENEFTHDVAIDGDAIAVGDQRDDSLGEDAGAVYVFRYNGANWFEEQKLFGSDLESGDIFGRSLSLRGDTLVVSARGDDDVAVDSGALYVFRYDGADWVQEEKLVPGDPSEALGGPVDLDAGEDVFVMGSAGDSGAALSAGAACVFRFDGASWILEQELFASDAEEQDDFGWSVAIDGDDLFIGAPREDAVASNSGSAYFFRYVAGVWQEEQKIIPSDGAIADWFGNSVDICGDLAIAGAFFDDDACDPPTELCESGSAYVLRREAGVWTEISKLTLADGAFHDLFGFSVTMDGNRVATAASSESQKALVASFDDPCDFLRGDADGDGTVNALADTLFILGFGFLSGPAPGCDDAADVDDDGTLNALADGLALLAHGFQGGAPPPAPFPGCGPEPTPDGLGCVTYLCP